MSGSRNRSKRWSSAPSANLAAWTYWRSEEHTSELQSLMRISYAVFCLKKQRDIILFTYKRYPITSNTSSPYKKHPILISSNTPIHNTPYLEYTQYTNNTKYTHRNP